jgi:hypothetical protein
MDLNLESLVVRGSVVVGGLADVRLGTSGQARTAPEGHPAYPWPVGQPTMGNNTPTKGITLGAGRSRRQSRAHCCSGTPRRSFRAGGTFAAASSTGLLARRAASVSEAARGVKACQGQTPGCSEWETGAR